MNDDGLLFPMDDLELWKRGEQPAGWLETRHGALRARCHYQTAILNNLFATASPDLAMRLNSPL